MRDQISYVWYESAYFLTHFACTLGLSLRTEGRCNVPARGPALVIANHQSYLDPVLVGLATRRHLRFLARKSLFRNPLFGQLISSLRAVPIDQEGVGKEGLKTVLEQLKQGQAVLVFPEGSRTPDGRMHPFRPGVQLLLSRTKAPIIPVGIAGAYDAWPVWRAYPVPAPIFIGANEAAVAVSIGRPLPAERFENMSREQVLDELFAAVQAAQQRAERLRRK